MCRSTGTCNANALTIEVPFGEVAERLNAPVLKTGKGASPSWVRIPPSPPHTKKPAPAGFFVCGGEGDLMRTQGFDHLAMDGQMAPRAARVRRAKAQDGPQQSHPRTYVEG